MQSKKVALIAGITGQDGIYLSKFLINKDFLVIGLSRRLSYKKKNLIVLKTNYSLKSLQEIILKYNPIHIYNFAAVSDPSISWIKPKNTFKSIIDITLNFLEIISMHKKKKIKFFNASSSEIFKNSEKKINENSSIFPSNPYGIARSAGHFLVIAYRKNYDIFSVNGIFFNHESPFRGKKFLLKYLIAEAIKAKKNKNYKIKLKDSRPIRDFGFAEDYMEAAYKIMNLKKPQDFVIATGKSISVNKLALKVMKKLNLPSNRISYEKKNEKYLNLSKLASIKKIKKITKWRPKKTLDDLINLMIDSEKN